MLMKEIKDDRHRGKDIPYSWLGKINIVKMTILIKTDYIQCNLYQIANGIFHRTRRIFPKMCMEANQKKKKKKKKKNL